MILYTIHKVPVFRKLYFRRIGRPFVEKKIRPLQKLLEKEKKILDIGSGNGLVSYLLREKGFDITQLDIHYGNYDPSVKPVLYDGSKIPFGDKSFHTGIILTVLHHIKDPDIVLQEAARVCKYLIIMEDIYRNPFEKHLTFFLDSLANLFYSPCPHTNRDDAGWKQTFRSMNMKLISTEYRKVIFVVRQAIYFVECQPSENDIKSF